MIYLHAEVKSGLGEDTFWTWFEREFPGSVFGDPGDVCGADDIILQYSTMGPSGHKDNTIALMWELYPEMKRKMNSNEWDDRLAIIHECARNSNKLVVASRLAKPDYTQFGQVDIIPIGVNTDLFTPMDKLTVRNKHRFSPERKLGIWCGTTHRMKGYQNLLKYKTENPDIDWIIIWKQQEEAGHLEGARNYTLVNQETLAELLNCADFFLSSGLLRPYYMVEWEAMACNVPIVDITGLERDFIVSGNPRTDVFNAGWSRHDSKKVWEKYIVNMIKEITL